MRLAESRSVKGEVYTPHWVIPDGDDDDEIISRVVY